MEDLAGDEPRERLAAYLAEHTGVDARAAAGAAERLLTATTAARWTQALFTASAAIDRPRSPDPGALADDVDLDAIRAQVSAALPA